MTKQQDRRGRLAAEPFSYDTTKNGKVFIAYEGQTVTVLKAKPAERFLRQIAQASMQEAQLIMARATGNFRRGNERDGKIAQNNP